MSIARAFTMRSRRSHNSSDLTSMSTLPAPPPARAATMKGPGKVVDRSLISGPTFMHSTNTLAMNAPDVATVRALRKASSSISSGSSRGSADDSDTSSFGRRSRDTQLTDASSVENSPSNSPNVSQTDSYFHGKVRTSNVRTSRSSADLRSQPRTSGLSHQISLESPQRLPSFSRTAREQRSFQNLSSNQAPQTFAPPPPQPQPQFFLPRQPRHLRAPSPSPASSSAPSQVPTPSFIPTREQRVSIDMFSANIDIEAHPFGKELEQLAEVVNEYGNLDREADLTVMLDRRLERFCADDYIMEIQPLFQRCFGPPLIQIDPVGGWI